ncbi:hypothetical protein HOC35_03360 [Candidatus Woesearchaeota archaeon]|nr:hypothetical protein [Candidatus Woesearchaeota archaeon]
MKNLRNLKGNKKIWSILLFVSFLVILFSIFSVVVTADKSHIFQEKNEILNIDGHKIVVLDATTEGECLFTINGDGYIISEKNKKGTSEIDVYVKRAFPIRTKGEKSLYCEVLIDVMVPRNKNSEEDKKTNQVDVPEEETEDQNLPVIVDKVNETESDDNLNETKKSQGFFSKLWGFIKQLFS